MKVKGELKGITREWTSDEYIIAFKVREQVTQEMLDEIKDSKLCIEAKKYREKRSLNANSYFHVLVGKLADELRISKPRCKNILLSRYGQPYLLENDAPAVIKSNVPVSQMLELEEPHCFPCGSKIENGQEVTFYKMLRGSHTYDTREMSILIDGTVEECKDIGIETLTPNELAKLKSLWGAK